MHNVAVACVTFGMQSFGIYYFFISFVVIVLFGSGELLSDGCVFSVPAAFREDSAAYCPKSKGTSLV